MADELHTLPPFPAGLAEHLHFAATGKLVGVLSVAHQVGTHLFLTSWVSAARAAGWQITVKKVDHKELSQLKADSKATDFASESENSAFRRRAHEMVVLASSYGASDIHLQARAEGGQIEFAVAGRLRVAENLGTLECKRLMIALFQGVAENTDVSYIEKEHQNAQIAGDLFPKETGIEAARIVRGHCYPEHAGGEFMTLRLQYRGGYRPSTSKRALPEPPKPAGSFRLRQMGYLPSQIEKLEYLMAFSSGLIPFTGPTGSGKTTTIYEFIAESRRRRPYRRWVTAEDPVEIPIDGTVQLNVMARDQETTADAYSLALRTMLRMAPNNILIGELRDAAVAETAFEAAMTGHGVLTTLHVNEPFQFVDRLELMGRGSATLNRQVMCDPGKVRGVIAQRLLAHVCPHCSVPLAEAAQSKDPALHREPRILKALASWGDLGRVRLLHNGGCEHCSYTGVRGRYAVAEIVITDTALMRDYIDENTAVARERYQAREEADAPLLHLAIARALAGLIDPTEVELIEPIPMRPEKGAKLPIGEVL